MTDHTPDALASALPAGIQYDVGGDVFWDTMHIAKFQAERLAESGYQLVYVGDQPDTIAGALMKLSREGKLSRAHAETVAAALAEAATEAGGSA